MDRLQRQTESIVDKAPIVVGGEPGKGYTGIRTTIQVRDLRTRQDPETGAAEFTLDAVINTEIRRGSRGFGQAEGQEQITAHHRELAEQLLTTIHEARKDPPLDEPQPPKLVTP